MITMKARFITLEGGDGSGKSTLLAKIEKDFTARKIPWISTREPGGTPAGEEIREIILRKPAAGTTPIAPLTELLLYEAARAEHVEKLIRPTLAAGKTVLCDRFTHSSVAYQGAARGLGTELVSRLNHAATSGLEPDAVIWLKLDPVEARKRTGSRGGENRLDAEKHAFHQAVFDAFCKMAEDEANHFIVLDASASPDEVFAALCRHPLWIRLFGSASP
jgi:dTMP kinase